MKNKFYSTINNKTSNNKNKHEDTFQSNINKRTNKLVFKISENVIQLIIGSLTFVSGLAWNNYMMKNYIINNNIMYPLGITVVTSLLIIFLSYFHFDPNQ